MKSSANRKGRIAVEGERERVHLAFDMEGAEANGGQPPIIFLHAMTHAKESWQNVMQPIAEATRRKVYAYDARNHGDSGWSEKFDYEIMQEDLLQFMDSIHSEKAILIGHSMGGRTAMHFATNWPERVEKLIVEDLSPKSVGNHLRDKTAKYLKMLPDAVENIPSDVRDLHEAKNFVYEFVYKNKSQADNNSARSGSKRSSILPLCKDERGRFKWKTNLKVLEEEYLLKIRQPADVTGLYEGPTLMLYGTKSPYKVSEDREYIKCVFPESRLRAIEGATHRMHADHADVFVREVVDFINES